jgi:uncharacterized protein YecT (DUF1311 family)
VIVRVTFIVLGVVTVLAQSLLHAQQRPSAPSQMQLADAQLNRNYQQVMQTLSPSAKEQLRKGEHAWLDFIARNKAAFQAAAPRLGLSAARCEEIETDEFFNRAHQLSGIFRPDRSENEKASSRLARVDEELNVVYQRCLGAVTGSDAQKLRDAQKAWVVFRDANNGFGPYLFLVITGNRIEQLNNFYIKTAREPSRIVQEKADPSVPDPFERAR